MTYRELYLKARRDLAAAGIDPPGTDSLLLLEHFFGLDRPGLALRGQESPPPDREGLFLRAVRERCGSRPLQYILGQWEFMGLTLSVGEGVLIPREDTATLVESSAHRLRSLAKQAPGPAGLDLCAGSGAVSLGLCSLVPETRVVCVELSQKAFPFLKKNLSAYPQYHVKAVKGDVLRPETAKLFSPASLDFIVSNPPYIETGELPALQPEVRQEPSLALDGGPDGLVFYRALCSLWLPLLKPGGILAVEIGETQARAVTGLFSAAGLRQVEVFQDLSGLDRCVLGTVPESP